MWRKIEGHLASAGAGALVASLACIFFFRSYVGEFRHEAKLEAQNAVLEETAAVAKAPDQVVPCPPVGKDGAPGLVVPKLKPKDEDRIRKAHGVEDHPPPTIPAVPATAADGSAIGGFLEPPKPSEPAKRFPILLTEGKIEKGKMAYGGEVAAWLGRDGKAFLTMAPKPRRFIGLELRNFELGGLYGTTNLGARWRAWGAWEPLRLGNFHLRLEAGTDGRAGGTDSYAMVGATWRPFAK